MAFETLGIAPMQHVAGKVIQGLWFNNQTLRTIGMDILKRHSFKCASCGFASRPSKQVPHAWMVPVDTKHPGLTPVKNGQCLCPFCASALAINWSVVGRIKKGFETAPGMLIHCPWLTQAQLSLLAIYVVSVKANCRVGRSSAVEAAARSIDASISALREDVGLHIPIYRGQDGDFARSLAMLPMQHYEERHDLISSLRFWPNLEYWETQGLYWQKARVGEVHANFAVQLEGFL